jgi:DnaJ-class molecular chaperone
MGLEAHTTYDHYYTCPKCNGAGMYWLSARLNIENRKEYGHYHKCILCEGRGEVNWLENVFGVEWNI